MKPLNLTKALAYALSAVTCTALLAALPTSAMAQSRSASPTLATAPVRDNVGVEANPFIRVVPESTAPLECSGDYSLKLDIDKNVIQAGDSAMLTMTIKGKNIQPKPLSSACLAAWFKFSAENTFSKQRNGKPTDPFLFKTVACIAPTLPNTSCMHSPNPLGTLLSIPQHAMVGWPIGSLTVFGSLYLNYGEERIYSIEMKRTVGNTKTWEASKMKPASGAFNQFKAKIAPNSSLFAETNLANNEDVIYFYESALIPIKLSKKTSINEKYLAQSAFQLQSEKSGLYKNIVHDPKLTHVLTLKIKPLTSDPQILNFSNVYFNFSNFASKLNSPTYIDNGVYTFVFQVPANTVSNNLDHFFLNAQMYPSDWSILKIHPDVNVSLSVSSATVDSKVIYSDTIKYKSGNMNVGVAISNPLKWTKSTNNSFTWESDITIQNFTNYLINTISLQQTNLQCASVNGAAINFPLIPPVLQALPPLTKESIKHIFNISVLSPSSMPVSCTGYLTLLHIGSTPCVEPTKAAGCSVIFREQSVVSLLPDANGNGDPADDADSFTISAP